MTNTIIKKEFLDPNLVDKIVTTITSSATPTPTGDAMRNELIVTALATNTVVGAPTGTLNANGSIKLKITSTGAYTVGYNAALLAGNVTRTTALTTGQTLLQVYEAVDGDYVCAFEDVIG
jgi:hypothetical protein